MHIRVCAYKNVYKVYNNVNKYSGVWISQITRDSKLIVTYQNFYLRELFVSVLNEKVQTPLTYPELPVKPVRLTVSGLHCIQHVCVHMHSALTNCTSTQMRTVQYIHTYSQQTFLQPTLRQFSLSSVRATAGSIPAAVTSLVRNTRPLT